MTLPVRIGRKLRGQAWTEQIDRTKEADAVAHLPSLDAIVIDVPRAILGLVGHSEVDAHAARRGADVALVDLVRRLRRARAGEAEGGVDVAPAALASEVGVDEPRRVAKVDRREGLPWVARQLEHLLRAGVELGVELVMAELAALAPPGWLPAIDERADAS